MVPKWEDLGSPLKLTKGFSRQAQEKIMVKKSLSSILMACLKEKTSGHSYLFQNLVSCPLGNEACYVVQLHPHTKNWIKERAPHPQFRTPSFTWLLPQALVCLAQIGLVGPIWRVGTALTRDTCGDPSPTSPICTFSHEHHPEVVPFKDVDLGIFFYFSVL